MRSRRTWHVAVVPHRGRLLLQYRDPGTGRWRQTSTGWDDTPENRERAEREARKLEREVYAMEDALGDQSGPLTVDAWARTWLERRKNRDAENDRARLELHVLPTLGPMLLGDVQPRHLAALAVQWQAKAPRTRRNIYSVVKAFFRDARIEGVLDGPDPCILTHRQLGKIRDGKGFVRREAVYRRDELEALIADERVPWDRRVWYGLLGLGMLRTGEAAGLRWSCVQPAEPLGRIAVETTYDRGETKTGEERLMPVHPALAALLAAWKLGGWARAMGRPPGPDDFVCPVPPPTNRGPRKPAGAMRDRHWARKRLVADLAKLEMRHRRAHDLRRTGVSLAQDDGADRAILRWGTHAPPTEVFDLYTTLHWTTLCREVAKLRIARPAPILAKPGEPLA